MLLEMFATLSRIPVRCVKWLFIYNVLMYQLGSLENPYGFLQGGNSNSAYLFTRIFLNSKALLLWYLGSRHPFVALSWDQILPWEEGLVHLWHGCSTRQMLSKTQLREWTIFGREKCRILNLLWSVTVVLWGGLDWLQLKVGFYKVPLSLQIIQRDFS